MFAKRHYEAIALAMQAAHPKPVRGHGMKTDRDYACEFVQWDYTRERLADVFSRHGNGQFKRERFLLACEPGRNVRARS